MNTTKKIKGGMILGKSKDSMAIVRLKFEAEHIERNTKNYLLEDIKEYYKFTFSIESREFIIRSYDDVINYVDLDRRIDVGILKSVLCRFNEYHLNDLLAGTKNQINYLRKHNISNWANDFDNTCDSLAKVDLLVDKGYKFGSGWLVRELSKETIMAMKKTLNEVFTR